MVQNLKERQIVNDRPSIWRPFTQEKNATPSLKIVKGQGLYLESEDGRKYADLISSWWVTLHGHAQIDIASAIAHQCETLEQVIFTSFTHDAALHLIECLQTVLPKSLNRFFFSDNGSTSVEIALKMAYQFFKNQGRGRNLFLHLEGSYHGDTFGAMSVSGKESAYHFNFSEFFFPTLSIPVPEFYDACHDIEEKEESILFETQKQLEKTGDKVCALIVEPLLQGARGMVAYRACFLDRLVRLVRQFGILVIFDEVMTGFYRTGHFFAMDLIEEKPDIICLSKGLTGGFLPMALTISTSKIYEAFLSDDWKKALIHGHSYTGNPLGCAAACQSFDLLMQPETQRRIQNIHDFYESLDLNFSNVSKRRSLGTMLAFDLTSNEQAKEMAAYFWDQGLFIRPLGNTVYFLPPYCIEEKDFVRVKKVLMTFLTDTH